MKAQPIQSSLTRRTAVTAISPGLERPGYIHYRRYAAETR